MRHPQKRKSPELGGGGALKKLATGEATNSLILPQNNPTRQQICFDRNGLRSIGHRRGAVCFCAAQGKSIRPNSPACSYWPAGIGGAYAG